MTGPRVHQLFGKITNASPSISERFFLMEKESELETSIEEQNLEAGRNSKSKGSESRSA